MKFQLFLSSLFFLFISIVHSQDIQKETVESEGVVSNITGTTTGMYDGTTSEKAQVFFDKAYSFAMKEDYKSAKKLYLKAINEDPNFVEAYDNIGRVYRRTGDYDKAIKYYNMSLELYPNGIMAHQNLAVVYGIQKKYDNAITEYEAILKISPNDAEGYFGLANSNMMLSKFEKALENADKALSIYLAEDSHHKGDGYYLKALINYYAGNTTEAATNLQLAKDNGASIDPALERELLKNSKQQDTKQAEEKTFKLEKPEDYVAYEDDFVKLHQWLLNNPVDKEKDKRKTINAFLLQWMTGSPTVSIEISQEISPYIECGDCLFIYMSGYSAYAITNKDNNKLKATISGTNDVIAFYLKNKKSLGKNKHIEKFIKLKEKNKLEDYIKSNI